MENIFSANTTKPFAFDAYEMFVKELPNTTLLDENLYEASFYSGAWGSIDYLISYISPYVFAKRMLEVTKIAAINFHPGPPEYPGIGCTNFALYDGADQFGITVHHMEPKVDSGEIIMVKRFPIVRAETVWSLSQKCYAYIFAAFCELLPLFAEGDNMRNLSKEVWQREPYTRKELEELCVITEDMDDEEVARRVRATTFPDMPGARIYKGGYTFEVSH